jgi:hypothetical protein
VRLNLAEQLCSRLELIRCEMLVAHHQNVPLGKGAGERGVRFAIDWLGEVEAGDFDARVIRQRRDGERRHRMTLYQGFLDWTLEPRVGRVKTAAKFADQPRGFSLS